MKNQILFSILLFVFSGCQQKKTDILTHEIIQAEAISIYDKVVEMRRDFHQYPELAGNEKRTKEFIEKYLIKLGIEVEKDVYGNGVVGVLNRNKNGKKIAWRADMDALPHDFPDEVAFKSKIDGVQHGCGHDVHMAIGLGIAAVLAKHKESIDGTVYFIFQPEEETFVGAKKMIENGLLSKLDLDEIYALHVTALPMGQIMVKANEMYAYQKRVQIKFKNEFQEGEVVRLYKEIKEKMSRFQSESKPWQIQDVFELSSGLTNPKTIFKDYLFMDEDPVRNIDDDELYLSAYLYETNGGNLSEILPKIRKIIGASKYSDLLLSVSFIQENPTVMNDENLTKKSIKTLKEIYGNDLLLPDYGQVPFFNDDFCYFQQNVPGVYFLLGGSNIEKGIVALNHAPNFNVDEECMKVGVQCFSSLIIERLKRE